MDDLGRKPEELKELLAKEMQSYELEMEMVSAEFVAFKFMKPGQKIMLTKHVLKINNEIMEDFSAKEIMNRLKRERWMEKLRKVGKKPLLLTKRGLKVVGGERT